MSKLKMIPGKIDTTTIPGSLTIAYGNCAIEVAIDASQSCEPACARRVPSVTGDGDCRGMVNINHLRGVVGVVHYRRCAVLYDPRKSG